MCDVEPGDDAERKTCERFSAELEKRAEMLGRVIQHVDCVARGTRREHAFQRRAQRCCVERIEQKEYEVAARKSVRERVRFPRSA
jgi:hypothetical protein